MIYQTEELLHEIMQEISRSRLLQMNVHLVGKLPHHILAEWYSAADFFISGSHNEGSGYALLEAMNCGCIPVVTAIPSFNKITAGGEYGYLFQAGNVENLVSVLDEVQKLNISDFSEEVLAYSKADLGFKKIAGDVFNLVERLVSVKR